MGEMDGTGYWCALEPFQLCRPVHPSTRGEWQGPGSAGAGPGTKQAQQADTKTACLGVFWLLSYFFWSPY